MARTEYSNKSVIPAGIRITMPETAIREKQQTKTNKSPIKHQQKTPCQYEDALLQKTQTTRENAITACISLEGNILSYVPLRFAANQQKKAFVGTTACDNAISEEDYQELKSFGS